MRLSIFAIASVLLSSLAASSIVAMDPPNPSPNDWVPFVTFDKGYWSHFGPDNPFYKGEHIVIRNQTAWASFWYNHTGGIPPQPPVPTNISWDTEMVLAAIMGTVTTCCASYIEFTGAYRDGDNLTAHINRVYGHGMLPVMTSPYHIIVIEKVPNVRFSDPLFDLDFTPPFGTIEINNGDAWTESTSVTLELSFFDDLSGVSEARYSNDGVFDTEPWEIPSWIKSWTLTQGDGTKVVYYQLKDNARNTFTTWDHIGLDTNPPTGFIVIDDGESLTNSTSVQLRLNYSDLMSGVAKVRYSNDGEWDDEPWESPSTTKAWTLESGDGTRIVYYQVKDNASLESVTYSDDIGLDTTPPYGSITINGGDAWTNSTSVTLTLTYSDDLSGVSQVRYSNDDVWDTEVWESPSITKAWTLTPGGGTETVYYQVKDNAGLESITYSDDIRLVIASPTIVSTTPSNVATDVEVTSNIIITFSEKMNQAATENSFSLWTDNNEIGGTIAWTTDGKTLFFIPMEHLEHGTTYQITITTAAKDTVGNNLVTDSETSFTTKEEEPEEKADFLKDYWWIILVIVIIILVITLIVERHRKNPRFEEDVPTEKTGSKMSEDVNQNR